MRVVLNSSSTCSPRGWEHPLLVARGDAAGIARETGIITSAKRLQKLAAGAASWARARALLEAHGVQNLQNRVRTAGHAPMEVEDPPALAPLPAGRAQDAGGPLPVDHVWLPAEQAQLNIAQRDEGGGDDEGGGNGESAMTTRMVATRMVAAMTRAAVEMMILEAAMTTRAAVVMMRAAAMMMRVALAMTRAEITRALAAT